MPLISTFDEIKILEILNTYLFRKHCISEIFKYIHTDRLVQKLKEILY